MPVGQRCRQCRLLITLASMQFVLCGHADFVQMNRVLCLRPSEALEERIETGNESCFQERTDSSFQRLVPFATVPRSGTTFLRRVIEHALNVSTESVYDEGGSCRRRIMEVDLYSECIDGWAKLSPSGSALLVSHGEAESAKTCPRVCGCANRPLHASEFPRYCSAVQDMDYIFAKTHFPFLDLVVWPPFDMLPGSIPGILITVRHPLTNFDAWRRFQSDPKNNLAGEEISFASFLDLWEHFVEFWEDFATQKGVPLLIVRYEDMMSEEHGAQTFVDLFAAAGLACGTDEIRSAVAFVSRLYREMEVLADFRCKGGSMSEFGVPAYGDRAACGQDVSAADVALLGRGTAAGEALHRLGYHQRPPTRTVAEQRQAAEAAEAGEEGCAGECEHRVLLELQGADALVLCTHAPHEDVLSRIFHEEGGYRGLEYTQALCRSGPLHCAPGRLMVDAGAAFGFLALYGAVRGMEVLAVEPLAVNAERLLEAQQRTECRLRRPLPLSVLHLGLGADGGAATFHAVEGNLGATVACSAEQRLEGAGSRAATASLPALVGARAVHYLHLNCQGCELGTVEALLAAGLVVEHLMLLVPPAQGRCALHAEALRALQLLQAAGYCLFEMAPIPRAQPLREPPLSRPIESLEAWTARLPQDAVLQQHPLWSSFVFASRHCGPATRAAPDEEL